MRETTAGWSEQPHGALALQENVVWPQVGDNGVKIIVMKRSRTICELQAYLIAGKVFLMNYDKSVQQREGNMERKFMNNERGRIFVALSLSLSILRRDSHNRILRLKDDGDGIQRLFSIIQLFSIATQRLRDKKKHFSFRPDKVRLEDMRHWETRQSITSLGIDSCSMRIKFRLTFEQKESKIGHSFKRMARHVAKIVGWFFSRRCTYKRW